MNTKSVGEITEAVVLAEFLKAGFPVLLPFGENQRYDMVVDAGGRFLRVQCKTASRSGWQGDRSVIRFAAHSGSAVLRDYHDDADLFAAYAPSTGQVYVIPVAEAPTTEVWLRTAPARNGQHRKIRLAEDHTLAAWAERAIASR